MLSYFRKKWIPLFFIKSRYYYLPRLVAIPLPHFNYLSYLPHVTLRIQWRELYYRWRWIAMIHPSPDALHSKRFIGGGVLAGRRACIVTQRNFRKLPCCLCKLDRVRVAYGGRDREMRTRTDNSSLCRENLSRSSIPCTQCRLNPAFRA